MTSAVAFPIRLSDGAADIWVYSTHWKRECPQEESLSSNAIQIEAPLNVLDRREDWSDVTALMQGSSLKFLDNEPDLYTEDDGQPI